MAKASGSIDLKSLKIAGEPNKYVTFIDSTNGIRVHKAGETNSNFAQINSYGLQVYKGGQTDSYKIAEFGETSYIGKHDGSQSYMQLDFNSLRMIDKEGDPYFYVGDLRGSNGKAQVSETFNILENESSPGSPNIDTYYVLKGAVATTSDVTSVKINGTSVSNWQASIESTGMCIKFTSSTGISVGDLVTVIYYSSGRNQKALTFGTRNYPSYINVPGQMSIAMGKDVIAEGMYSFATGLETEAYGVSAHAEGECSKALGGMSHAEGSYTTASGRSSHAEGGGTQATGERSHAEGLQCIASEDSAHAEGSLTTASQISSHAEGANTTASGPMSHAEGFRTVASNSSCHAEGQYTTASGYMAHAEGEYTRAQGRNAHSQNCYTVATENNQTVIGKYNTATRTGSGTTADPYVYTNAGDYAFIIGNGSGDATANRSNALTVDWNGNINMQGDITMKSHSSPIGNTLSASGSYAITTANINTYVQGPSLPLTAGVWVVTGRWQFSTLTSASTARLVDIDITDVAGTTASSSPFARERVVNVNGSWCALTATAILNLTADKTVYVKGSASQTSTAQTCYISAVRIV